MPNLFSNRVSGLVSIVMGTYNREKYIIDAVESIKNQTYKNIELIIVDDGSTDNTESIIQEWQKNNQHAFENLLYLKLPRNCEEEWAFNIAFCCTSGEYIGIQHSDDISHNNRVQKQVDFLLNHPETACVGARFYNFKDSIENITALGVWVCCDRNEIEKNYENNSHCVCNGVCMFRSYVFEEMIGYRKNKGYIASDWIFFKLISMHGYVIDNIPDALYYYRIHGEQTIAKDAAHSERGVRQIRGRASVVLPLYRSGKDVIRALKSIMEQTYNDIEIVIVDELLDEILEKEIKDFYSHYSESHAEYPARQFIYFKLPQKVGYPWIYNIGAYLSMGEYIVLHGDDGVSERNKIEKQVEFLRYNTVYDAVGTAYEPDRGQMKLDEEIERSYMLEYEPCMNMNTILFKTDVINTIGGLNQSMPGREDFEFIRRIIEDNYRVQNIRDVLYSENSVNTGV